MATKAEIKSTIAKLKEEGKIKGTGKMETIIAPEWPSNWSCNFTDDDGTTYVVICGRDADL